jgi:hypothetical protein
MVDEAPKDLVWKLVRSTQLAQLAERILRGL